MTNPSTARNPDTICIAHITIYIYKVCRKCIIGYIKDFASMELKIEDLEGKVLCSFVLLSRMSTFCTFSFRRCFSHWVF